MCLNIGIICQDRLVIRPMLSSKAIPSEFRYRIPRIRREPCAVTVRSSNPVPLGLEPKHPRRYNIISRYHGHLISDLSEVRDWSPFLQPGEEAEHQDLQCRVKVRSELHRVHILVGKGTTNH